MTKRRSLRAGARTFTVAAQRRISTGLPPLSQPGTTPGPFECWHSTQGRHNDAVSIREQVQAARSEILSRAAKHGASHVRLFGSVARGDDHPGSDVDILIELEPGRSLRDHAALVLELEALLGRRVDVATERGLRPRYRDRILAEAIAL